MRTLHCDISINKVRNNFDRSRPVSSQLETRLGSSKFKRYVILEKNNHNMTVKPWKKNLYENEEYPDNYTDESFLVELRKNVHIKDIPFKNAVLGAGIVAQEMSIIVIFSMVFVYLYNNWVEAETIFVQSSLMTLLGYLAYRTFFVNVEPISYEILVKDMQLVLIFIVFGYFLSPILKTLTDTISTDTIYATTTFMMCIHLIFFDYGVSAAIVSSSLSLNAAIFGSVCLASRLSSPFHAFVLLTVSVECFALMPSVLTKFSDSFLVLAIIVSVATYFLWTLSATMAVLFACALLFIIVLCPLWFIRWQRYKDNIYGPWDEAVVHDADM